MSYTNSKVAPGKRPFSISLECSKRLLLWISFDTKWINGEVIFAVNAYTTILMPLQLPPSANVQSNHPQILCECFSFGTSRSPRLRRPPSGMLCFCLSGPCFIERLIDGIKQCAIPVFDGLIPGPLNPLILKLLFCFAEWHALAKLRMQTDATIGLLEEATRELGDLLRAFVCATEHVPTVETKREAEKRERDAKKKEAEKEAKEKRKREREEKRREKQAEKEAKRRGKEAEREAKGKTKKPPVKSKPPPKNKRGNPQEMTTRSLTVDPEEPTADLANSRSGLGTTVESGPPVPGSSSQQVPSDNNPTVDDATQGDNGGKQLRRKPVKMNISTVKFHMLGHYVTDIKRVGPTDFYSTEWVR